LVIGYNQQKKDRQHNNQQKKNRQHNNQQKKDKQHNNQQKKDRQLPLWYLVVIVLYVILLSTASDYHFDFLWSFYCMSFFYLRLLITTLVSCGHCIVCHSSIYGFWLPLWYLVVIVLCVILLSTYGFWLPLWYLVVILFCVILLSTASDYHFGILWSLYCVSFFYLRLLINTLVSCGHCIVFHSSTYGFWLPLWYLVVILLCVILLSTASD
jgi:hypothetical protein